MGKIINTILLGAALLGAGCAGETYRESAPNPTPMSARTQRTRINDDDKWQTSVNPYFGGRFALDSRGNKPDTMPFAGASFRAEKGRFGVELGVDHGELNESESTPTSRAELESQATTLGVGVNYDLMQKDKFRLRAGAGTRVMFEDNSGYLELATQTGTERRDINDRNALFGAEAKVEAEYSPNDKLSVTVGANYGHNFDSENVDNDLSVKAGVKVKF
jgi:hypothetical protein